MVVELVKDAIAPLQGASCHLRGPRSRICSVWRPGMCSGGKFNHV